VSYHARGFTLVELLVVIAIVAVLAALSVAGFSKAISRGHQAKCASNLRQLGVATQSYAADNDGRLPMTYGTKQDYRSPPWYQPLVAYVGTQMKAGSVLAVQESGRRVFQCPAYRTPPAPARDVTYAPSILSADRRISQVVKPSSKIWLITSTDSYSVNGLMRVNFPHNNNSRTNTLSGEANVLYFDGHSAFIKEDALRNAPSFPFDPIR
jgi:prepilin-type N-terminal cleavage/methylation domain-containing protein/prepilin-type processing-associated H-X9-DG protein